MNMAWLVPFTGTYSSASEGFMATREKASPHLLEARAEEYPEPFVKQAEPCFRNEEV